MPSSPYDETPYYIDMHFRSVLSLLVVILLLTGCRRPSTVSRPVLIATIEPVRFVVEAVAGDKYSVRTIMPRGASPETYEPTPAALMELQQGEAVFCVGTLGFEQTRLPKMLENVPNLPLHSLSDSIRPIISNISNREKGVSLDPHVWMSPRNLVTMAENTCRVLSKMDSLNAPYYSHRLDSFRNEMNVLHETLKTQLTPLTHRAFLIYHPALGYFARDFGLEQLTVEYDGKEPSASDMRQLVNRCRALNVKAVLISEEHTGRGAKRVAETLGTKPQSINPLDYDVPAELRRVTNALTR